MGLKTIISSIIILLAFQTGNAQTRRVVISEVVDTVKEVKNGTYGPNLDHYSQVYYGWGFTIGEDFELNNILRSGVFDIGFRYKRKLSRTFSFNMMAGWQRARFANAVEEYIDPNIEEVYDLNTWMLAHTSLGPRINFDRNRGDFLGTYLEFRVVGGAVHTLINRQRIDDNNTNTQQMNRISWPGFRTDRFVLGYAVELGFNVLSVQFQYLPTVNSVEINGQSTRSEPYMVTLLVNLPNEA